MDPKMDTPKWTTHSIPYPYPHIHRGVHPNIGTTGYSGCAVPVPDMVHFRPLFGPISCQLKQLNYLTTKCHLKWPKSWTQTRGHPIKYPIGCLIGGSHQVPRRALLLSLEPPSKRDHICSKGDKTGHHLITSGSDL